MFIRRAITAELPAIVSLVNDAYRGESAGPRWTSEAAIMRGDRTTLALLRQTLAGPGEPRVLTMRDQRGGPLLGCVLVERLEAELIGLGMLSIAPTMQNRGLGRRLIGVVEAYGREVGAQRLRITVIQVREALLAWYERQGFARTGALEPFPAGDTRFGIPLRDDLHFVVLEKPLSTPP